MKVESGPGALWGFKLYKRVVRLKVSGLGLLGAVLLFLLGIEVWIYSGICGDLADSEVVSRDENVL